MYKNNDKTFTWDYPLFFLGPSNNLKSNSESLENLVTKTSKSLKRYLIIYLVSEIKLFWQAAKASNNGVRVRQNFVSSLTSSDFSLRGI